MQDDLLMQLANASSEEEKAYLLAMALLETQPPEIREAIVAAAVPHWFDAEILAALLTHPSPLPGGETTPESAQSGVETPARVAGVETPAYTPTPVQGENPSRSDGGIQTGGSTPVSPRFADLYCAIRNLNLPFVQPFGELGLTLHDLTRAGIRWHLFTHEPERFKAYSRRAAAYFAEKNDVQRRVESVYHLLASIEELGQVIFWKQMEIYCMEHDSRNLSAANMLLANLLELIHAGIVGGNKVERTLSAGYTMLGDLQRNRGSISAAEDSYRKSLALAERLAQADPANAEAQRDLSISYNKLGDLALQRGDLNAAQQAYQQYFEIAERLAQADPANAEAQRGLSVSCNKLGHVEELLNHAETALHLQEQAFSIAQTLFAKDPQNATVRNDVAEFKGVVERLRGDEAFARGEYQAALTAYQRAFDLSKQVAEEQLTNLDAVRDTYWNSYKIGTAFAALGQAEQAREAFRNALALAEPFAAQPENALAQRDVAMIRTELQGCV
ncbi:SEFIR domain protein [Candidatus Moduliflexus flocculans]|uniref:SEFIR domain protein n=1 Tax=Candidatus Moduliflexus flocculans TaxID=1499966 RepID=A0A081BT22_9BACT|nr:SEFIR domain protein [Candidatus Moduliflexus flocculans]